MFIIKPIADKIEQENACHRCGIIYDEDCLAYGAYINGVFSGMCQFRIRGESGYIRDLVPLPGVSDFEVMFIMGRQTMNYIDLCSVHTCYCRKDAGDTTLLHGIGFREERNGELYADMTGFFDGSHCASKSAKATENETN